MRTLFAAVVAAVVASAVPAAQSNMAQPMKLTSFAVDMSATAPRNNTTPLDITVNRWSTDAERDKLRETLAKGQDALLAALQKLPVVGYVNTPGSLRWDLHFARQTPLAEGGQSIILANDHGVGKASIATRVSQDDDGAVELENFSSEPVMLTDVHPVK